MIDEFHSSPNKQETHDDHIQVCVRIRPLVKEERDNDEVAWSWDKNVITQVRSFLINIHRLHYFSQKLMFND